MFDDYLWHLLLLLDFPTYIQSSSSSQSRTKFIYKTRFERDKERKTASCRRALLRKKSDIISSFPTLRGFYDVKLPRLYRFNSAKVSVVFYRKCQSLKLTQSSTQKDGS